MKGKTVTSLSERRVINQYFYLGHRGRMDGVNPPCVGDHGRDRVLNPTWSYLDCPTREGPRVIKHVTGPTKVTCVHRDVFWVTTDDRPVHPVVPFHRSPRGRSRLRQRKERLETYSSKVVEGSDDLTFPVETVGQVPEGWLPSVTIFLPPKPLPKFRVATSVDGHP